MATESGQNNKRLGSVAARLQILVLRHYYFLDGWKRR